MLLQLEKKIAEQKTCILKLNSLLTDKENDYEKLSRVHRTLIDAYNKLLVAHKAESGTSRNSTYSSLKLSNNIALSRELRELTATNIELYHENISLKSELEKSERLPWYGHIYNRIHNYLR